MKLRNVIILLILLSVSTGCIRMFKYAKSGGHSKYLPPRAEIKFTERPTGLDSLLKIDGEYRNELYITPVHFYTDGRAKVERRYGLYKLDGDTIVVDTYYQGYLMKRTYKFVIIDPETIQLVKMIRDDPVDGIEDISPRLNQIYKFQSVEDLDYDHNFDELYKRKWLWEREEDWQRWMDAQAIRLQSNKVNRKDGKLLNKLFGTTSFLDILNNTAFDFIGKRVKIERPETQNDSITLEEYMKSLADYKEIHGNISEQVRGSLHINSIDEKNRSGGYDAVITVVP